MRRSAIGLVTAIMLAALPAFAATPPAPAPSLPPGVNTSVQPERVRLGEPFHYRIAITRPANERFDVAPPAMPAAFELRALTRHRDDGARDATTTFDLTLALFELGPQRLPSVTIERAGPDGHTRLAVDGPSVTAVRSASKPGDKLYDIAGPVLRFVRALWLVFVGLGVLAAIAIVLLVVRRRRRRPRTLEARTRLLLDELARAHLPEAGHTQEFFFTLDDIVRRHLGERYAIDALECTTRELVAQLHGIEPLQAAFIELVHFLREADMVKFARASANLEASQAALAFAYRLVALTAAPPSEKGSHVHVS